MRKCRSVEDPRFSIPISPSPLPTTRNRLLRITLIQSSRLHHWLPLSQVPIYSSRLHHWLPLSQVPIYTGRSSEPLPSRVIVYAGHTTLVGQKVLYSREHNKVG